MKHPEICVETPQIASLTVDVQGLVYSILLNKLYTTHHQLVNTQPITQTLVYMVEGFGTSLPIKSYPIHYFIIYPLVKIDDPSTPKTLIQRNSWKQEKMRRDWTPPLEKGFQLRFGHSWRWGRATTPRRPHPHSVFTFLGVNSFIIIYGLPPTHLLIFLPLSRPCLDGQKPYTCGEEK